MSEDSQTNVSGALDAKVSEIQNSMPLCSGSNMVSLLNARELEPSVTAGC